MNERDTEQYVLHLRAIRSGIEPDEHTPLAEATRLYAAQGMIDGAIGLIMPPTKLPQPELHRTLGRDDVVDVPSRKV